MEVMMLTTLHAGSDFNFDSTCTSPSSPQRFGNYSFTTYDDQIITPISRKFVNDEENDTTEFTFDFGGIKFEDPHFICADELFHGGKMKPLKVMQSSKYRDVGVNEYSPRMSDSPKRIITKALMSERQESKDWVPLLKKEKQAKTLSKTNLSTPQKSSKSLSTLKISNMVSEPLSVKTERCLGETTTSSSNSTSSWIGKWKLTDIFLFRSASEGHATIRRSHDKGGDLKNLSFRSVDSGGSESRCGSRRKKGVVSGHEWHYKSKRAVEEEMKRKTFLPYKKNLLGCIDLDLCVSEFYKGDIKC